MDYKQYTIYIARCETYDQLDNIYSKIKNDYWLGDNDRVKLLRLITNEMY